MGCTKVKVEKGGKKHDTSVGTQIMPESLPDQGTDLCRRWHIWLMCVLYSNGQIQKRRRRSRASWENVRPESLSLLEAGGQV